MLPVDVLRMPDDKRKKVVQTELELDDYETLVNLVKSKNMTLKEATREALRSWTVAATDLTKDSLFSLKPVEFKVKIKADEIDAYLYNKRRK